MFWGVPFIGPMERLDASLGPERKQEPVSGTLRPCGTAEAPNTRELWRTDASSDRGQGKLTDCASGGLQRLEGAGVEVALRLGNDVHVLLWGGMRCRAQVRRMDGG